MAVLFTKLSIQRLLQALIVLGSILKSPLSFAEPPQSYDLSQRDWSLGATTLDGPWEFYWDRLLQANDPLPQPDEYFAKARGWTHVKLPDGRDLPAFGKATYRMRVKGLKPRPEGYQLGLYAADSAFTLIVYPEGLESQAVKASSGTPGSAGDEIPSRSAAFRVFFPVEGKDTIILIHVSNFQQAAGGLWQAPILGVHETARQRFDYDGLLNVLGLGVVVAIGIYSFMMFARRREDLPAICLAVTAFAAFLRITSTNPYLNSFLPDQAFWALKKIEFLSMPLGLAGYLAFLKTAFFPKDFLKTTLVYWSFHALLVTLAVLAPIAFVTGLVGLYQLSILLSALAMMYLIARALLQKQSGSLLVLCGCLLIVTGFIFDIVFTTELHVTSFLITPLCVAAFLILQSQLVAQRAAQAYRRAELYALELVEKEKARTLFFHNTSHELRTPLNGIIGFLQLVLKGRYGAIPEQANAQLAKSLRLADALKNQVNTILDIAKSRRGDLQKRNQLVSLTELKESADNLADGLRLKNENLTYVSQLNLSKEGPDFISDQEKILTIVRNLLGNAFKFSAPDRINHISFELRYSSQKILQISVQDTGIGIAREYHQKIFEEFAQVQGDARRTYEGTGLGLTMVRDLVKLLGGTIKVDSAPGVGSTFTIQIPSHDKVDAKLQEPEEHHTKEEVENLRLAHMRDRNATASTAAPQAPSQVQTPKISRAWNVLIIDDTETNCEVIHEILQEEGYRSSFQLSGRAGLIAMKKLKPDLVLLDMMMPEMSGEDVLKAMKAEPGLQDVPVVLITARASEEDRLVGLKLGVDDYLAKPIVAEELLLRVHNLLERHNLLREVERYQAMDKMVQMGTLFADLSHEIKNILNGASTVPKLQKQQILVALSPIELQEQYIQGLVQSLLSSAKNPETLKRMNAIHTIENDEYQSIRMSLKGLLAETSLPFHMMLNLWGETEALPVDELVFLENQLKVLTGYQTLAHITERTRSLSLSVLNYTRNEDDVQICQLEKVWPEVMQLAHSRTRKLAITWKVDLEDVVLSISPSALTQILLNLCLNAVDAIAELPANDRWIHVSMRREDQAITLVVENGGHAITEDVRSRLFTRGFTTKGDKGNGIGLFVSQRLAHQARGQLSFKVGSTHPTFELKLLYHSETSLAKSA